MNKKLQLVHLLLLLVFSSAAQTYNGPESMVYDSTGNRYLISNVNGNSILQLDAENNLTNFVSSDLNGPKGLLIVGDTLISINNTSIQGFLLADATRIMNITIDDSEFLNDATCDKNGNLYVSDMNKHRIYRVELKTSAYNIFNSDVKSPNGLLYCSDQNSILICSWGSNAKIQSLSLTDSVLVDLVSTKLSNLDGLARDNCGNIYVSSWGNNSVYAFDASFQKPPTKISEGHNGPADIAIQEDKQLLLIPNLNSNKIDFVDLGMECSATVLCASPANYSSGLDANVTIEWEEVASALGYNIEYGTDSLFYKTLGFKATEHLSTVLEDLTPATTYYWRVAAISSNTKTMFGNAWSFSTAESVVSVSDKFKADNSGFYPNPFNKLIYFIEPVKSFSVYTIAGQLLFHEEQTVAEVDLSKLNNGAYIINYVTASDKTMKQLLIKK